MVYTNVSLPFDHTLLSLLHTCVLLKEHNQRWLVLHYQKIQLLFCQNNSYFKLQSMEIITNTTILIILRHISCCFKILSIRIIYGRNKEIHYSFIFTRVITRLFATIPGIMKIVCLRLVEIEKPNPRVVCGNKVVEVMKLSYLRWHQSNMVAIYYRCSLSLLWALAFISVVG